MTVILARKNCIFEREGPRHYHLHNYKTELKSDIQHAPSSLVPRPSLTAFFAAVEKCVGEAWKQT